MAIIDGESGEVVGEIDNVRAIKECHPGAVYLHRATTWVIEQFDLQGGEIVARRDTPSYFTRPISDKSTEILEIFTRKKSFGGEVCFGKIRVTERVSGYQKRNAHTQKLVGSVSLELPEQTIETEGLWLNLPP
jgi:DEAD/DEAH box helicase domain-containing protein